MRILVDCDGVCNHFLADLYAALGVEYRPEEIWTNDFGKLFGRQKKAEADDLMLQPSFWAEILPRRDAQDAIDRLRTDGHDLVWVTSPWESCVGWETVRRGWLRRHFSVHPDHVAIMRRKELVDGDAIIEDKDENLYAWAQERPERVPRGLPLLFEQPYNRDNPHGFDRLDWPAILWRIEQLTVG